MPARKKTDHPHLYFVFGEDEMAVVQRGRAIHRAWSEELGGMDHEIVEAGAANVEEALTALGRLNEALQTLPFFGGGKAVWFKGCTFLGDDRTAASKTITESLGHLTDVLSSFEWGSVRLVITAGKTDKRKAFYKAMQKLATVEEFGGWSVNDKDWMDRAAELVRQTASKSGKRLAPDALNELVQRVGPDPKQLSMEVEKVLIYVGDAEEITADDVRNIAVRNKQARAFALAEAVGERNLPKTLRLLDEELWTLQFDRKKSEIGILYGIISKVRSLLMARELVEGGWIRRESTYPRFKAALDRVHLEDLPSDKKLNPLAMHPYVLFQAVQQSAHYRSEELVRAMERLLECNRQLVSSNREQRLVLQQTLINILSRDEERNAA